MAAQRDDRQRPLPSAQCSLCGMALPTSLLVPDGGQACADIRWYCRDAKSCTERWTANLPRHPHIAPTSASLAASAMPAPAMPAPGFAGPARRGAQAGARARARARRVAGQARPGSLVHRPVVGPAARSVAPRAAEHVLV